MKVTQKVLISLLISTVLFVAFAVAAFSGLFDLIDTRFYDQRVREAGQAILVQAQERTIAYQEQIATEIREFAELPAIQNAFLINQSREDIEAQTLAVGQLLDRRPEIEFLRVFDNGAGELWLSTREEDTRSISELRIEYLPVEELDPPSILTDSADPIDSVAWSTDRSALRIFVPVSDAFDIPRGFVVAWVSFTGLYADLLQEGLIGPTTRVRLSPEGNLVYNARRHFLAEDLGAIDGIVGNDEVLPLLRNELGESYALEYAVSGAPSVPPGVLLINEADLHMDRNLQLILLGSVFIVAFLLSYLVLNLRQEPTVVVTERFRRFQQAVLRDYLREGRAIGPDLWKRELDGRREQIDGELKRGLGKLSDENRTAIEQAMGSQWDELYRLIGSQGTAKAELEQVSLAQIEAIIERTIARHGGVSEPPAGYSARPAPKTTMPPASDEIEAPEEIEELSEAADVGPFAGMRPVEVEEIDEADELDELEAEEVEEAEEIEELESEQVADAGPFAGMRPVEVEEIDEAEEVDELEAEEVEEAEEIEELESEQAADAGPFAGMRPVEVEEIDETEELDELEELETGEPAEVVELDAGELDELEELETEEPAEVAELEAEEIDELEELESEEPADVAELEAEEIDELEELETEEPADVAELEAEEIDELDELEAEEPADVAELEAEELDELEELETEEPADVAELEAEEIDELEELEAEEPADVAELEAEELDELEELETEEPADVAELVELDEFEQPETGQGTTEIPSARADDTSDLETWELDDRGPLGEHRGELFLITETALERAEDDSLRLTGSDEVAVELPVADDIEARREDRSEEIAYEAVEAEDVEELDELEELETEKVEELGELDAEDVAELEELDEIEAEEIEEVPAAEDLDEFEALEEVDELAAVADIEPADISVDADSSILPPHEVVALTPFAAEPEAREAIEEDIDELEEYEDEDKPVVSATEIAGQMSSFLNAATSFGGRGYVTGDIASNAGAGPGKLAVFQSDELGLGPVRIRGVENVASYHVSEIEDFISVIGRRGDVIEQHRGSYRIIADAYSDETPVMDQHLANLADQIMNRRDVGSIDDIFGDSFSGLDFGDVLTDEPRRRPARDAEVGLRIGSDGFIFSSVTEKTDSGMRQVYRGLVRLTRQWDARVAVILELDADGNARGIYSLGVPEECDDQLGLAASTLLVRNVIGFRRVCLLKEPLNRFQGYESSCSAQRLTSLVNWLFLPLHGEDRIRYLAIGFPRPFEDLIDLSTKLSLLARAV